jgi:uncharacterized protein with NRDE domain
MLDQLINRDTIDHEDLFDLLYNKQQAPEDELPDTGIKKDLERALSPMFIRTEGYGTRCSTVITMDQEGAIEFEERTFDPEDQTREIKKFAFNISD